REQDEMSRIVRIAAVVAAAFGEAAVQPSGIAGEWANWGPPGVALVLAAVGVAMPRPDRARTMLVLAGVLVGAWIVLRWAALWLPVLPTALPATLTRTLVAVGAGLLVGVVGRLAAQALRTPEPTGEAAEGG
ncbi:MAG: hypothetical protein ACRDUY_13000, partial [Nitriliruptorales bacterium]